MIGERVLDVFTVKRLLGEGGMGAVYLAESEQRHRIVVKVLRPELAARPAMVRRFEEEARAAAEIRHPNIVEILGRGVRPDGTHFLALEYLDGKTLSAHIESWGPLPCEKVLPLLCQICAGLQAAHRRGIVHRDIKPDNIYVCDYPTRGLVKILDFGIARFLVDNMGLTDSNAMMGTPSYMAPEQASDAKSVTPAADIFAVAVIAYELLSGRRPYVAESLLSLLHNYVEIGAGRVAPARLIDVTRGRDIPTEWHHAIDRALHVHPDARPPTIRAFIDPLINSIPGGAEVADSVAPSLRDEAGPDDETSRTPEVPWAGGVPTPATKFGRNAASPVSVSPQTTLHEASGAVHTSRERARRTRRRVAIAVTAVVGLAIATGIAVQLAGTSTDAADTIEDAQSGMPTTGSPLDAAIVDAALVDADQSPVDARPLRTDAAARRRTTRDAGSSRPTEGAGIGEDEGAIFQ